MSVLSMGMVRWVGRCIAIMRAADSQERAREQNQTPSHLAQAEEKSVVHV